MNIGIDAGCLGVKDERLRVGVYQLTFNLLAALARLDRQNGYWLYSFNPIPPTILAQFGSRMRNIVVGPKFGWNYLSLPLNLAQQKPDVFLGPSQSLPRFLPCPGVVVVHDLVFEIFPEFYHDSHRQLRRITRQAVRQTLRIIAVSQATKKDLIRLYAVPKGKITVFYEGFDNRIFKPKLVRRPENYFLFVGALKKSKNLPGLLKGFQYFLTKSLQDFRLLIVGGDLWLDPEIKKTIKNLDLAKKVSFQGYVTRQKLIKLYQEATAFVSPAFYEGFGLTLVEAIACGCPVICGKDGSQPEVVGKAGILVDPQNEKEIGEAMIKVAANPQLRQEMVSQGLQRAELFSWKDFAKKTLALLEATK